jgi:hypothetical protein
VFVMPAKAGIRSDFPDRAFVALDPGFAYGVT